MLKVVENCRPAVPFARVLLICSLFAIGFASTARADEYQYTITFDPSGRSGLSMSATFLAGMLPGGLGTIVPASVQILNAPTWYSDPYGANIAVTATSVGWEIDTQTCPGGCDNIFDYLKPRDIGHVSLPLAIGDSQFYGNLQGWVVGGGGPLGIYNPEGGLTIVTTPEPNSGLMLAYAFYRVR